jgi:hypothetical protein
MCYKYHYISSFPRPITREPVYTLYPIPLASLRTYMCRYVGLGTILSCHKGSNENGTNFKTNSVFFSVNRYICTYVAPMNTPILST